LAAEKSYLIPRDIDSNYPPEIAASSDGRSIWIVDDKISVLDLASAETRVYHAGWADVHALAGGPPQYRWAAINSGDESRVIDLRTQKEVAWFPRAASYRAHPDGRSWVFCYGLTCPEIIRLEGDLK
jgi:hypothetical protein